MPSDKTVKNIRRITVIFLVGMPFLFVVSFFDQGKPQEELESFEGELVSLEVEGNPRYGSYLWLTLKDADGTFTACINDKWRAVQNLPLGSELEISGYHFGPCGIQAMEVISDGNVIVSYADFIEGLHRDNWRLRMMSGALFVFCLVAFLFSVVTRPDIKTFS